MKRFISDIKKYYKYTVYSAKSELKSEVANSYLNWLWWILDPLCFMLIYYVIFGIVFNAREDYFLAFIFIGLTIWDFFSRNINNSIRLVKRNKSIVAKVYLPKFVLMFVKIMVNGFKMSISIVLIIIMMVLYQVPLTVNVLYFIPLMLILIVFTFGCSCHLLHYGVFVEDLANVVTIVLRLLFYLTGIFFNIATRLPKPYNLYVIRYNPMAFLLSSLRNVLLYEKGPDLPLLFIWAAISLVLAATGIRKIYKNENSYVKVI